MKTKWLAIIGVTLALLLVVGLAGIGGWLLRRSIATVVADSLALPRLNWHGWGPGMMWGDPSSSQDGDVDGTFPCCGGAQWPDAAMPGTLTIDDAHGAVEAYLSERGYEALEVHEVMEFSRNFYAIVGEEDTGIGAMELLIDKETGAVGPEHGPNMMWNARYGMHRGGGWMMGGGGSGVMSIPGEEAVRIAQRWLDEYRPGTDADSHADAFYGYYTLHTLRGGQISGMLSVHGSTGQVWYHNWHGEFVQMIERHEDGA